MGDVAAPGRRQAGSCRVNPGARALSGNHLLPDPHPSAEGGEPAMNNNNLNNVNNNNVNNNN